MKNKLTNTATGYSDPAIERLIHERNVEINESVEIDARHFGEQNRPALSGDKISNFTNGYKTSYERLDAEASKRLLATSHFQEAKIDYEVYKQKKVNIDTEAIRMDGENKNDKHRLGNFNPGSLHARIIWAFVITIIIMIGEIIFNAKAFQVTGENMLFALILSLSVSFAVMIASHLASFLYKTAKNAFQRRLIIALSLFAVTGIFLTLAFFRSWYLASQDVFISPVYFVIINLFFFTVTALFSFFVLPTWQEIKQNDINLKLFKAINKRTTEIERLKKESEHLTKVMAESTKHCSLVVDYAKHISNTIRKMYLESVGKFKQINNACRQDRKTPDCFSDEIPELDIHNITINFIPTNQKP